MGSSIYTIDEPTIYGTLDEHTNHYTIDEPTIYGTRDEHTNHYTIDMNTRSTALETSILTITPARLECRRSWVHRWFNG
jgi:hypothetical protein